MSTFQVQNVTPKEPYTGNFGLMYPFNVGGLIDGQVDIVEMQFKQPQNAPKPGDTIQVTVENTPRGKKAKKLLNTVNTPQTDGPLPSTAMGKAMPTVTHPGSSFIDDRQESIEFQSARRDAIEFMKLRVTSLQSPEGRNLVDLAAFTTIDKVFEITREFMNKNRPSAAMAAVGRSAVEVFTDGTPVPDYTEALEEEIDTSDIPF